MDYFLWMYNLLNHLHLKKGIQSGILILKKGMIQITELQKILHGNIIYRGQELLLIDVAFLIDHIKKENIFIMNQ